LPSVSFRQPATRIHILRSGSTRHIPEAGAVCGNSARTDLCGRRGVTSVPTATIGEARRVGIVFLDAQFGLMI